MRPAETIVESKSLKLFLGAFRNHRGFHEDVTVGIGQRLAEEMKPLWLRIGGYWYPRGGIPIDVFWQTGAPPDGPVAPRPGRRALSRAGAEPARASSSTAPARSAAMSAAPGSTPGSTSPSSAARGSARRSPRNGLTLSDTRRLEGGSIPARRDRFLDRPDGARRGRHRRALRQEHRHRGRRGGDRRARPQRRDRDQLPERRQQCRDAAPAAARAQGRCRAWCRSMSSISAPAAGTAPPGAISRPRTCRRCARSPQRIGDRPGRLRLTDDMEGIAWGKLLINLNNAVNALSGLTILEELKQRDYRRVFAAAISRDARPAPAAGIEPARIGAVGPELLPHVLSAARFPVPQHRAPQDAEDRRQGPRLDGRRFRRRPRRPRSTI